MWLLLECFEEMILADVLETMANVMFGKALEKMRGSLAPGVLLAMATEDGSDERMLVTNSFGTEDVAKKFALGRFQIAAAMLGQVACGPGRLTKDDHTGALTMLLPVRTANAVAELDTKMQSKEDWSKLYCDVFEACTVSQEHSNIFLEGDLARMQRAEDDAEQQLVKQAWETAKQAAQALEAGKAEFSCLFVCVFCIRFCTHIIWVIISIPKQ